MVKNHIFISVPPDEEPGKKLAANNNRPPMSLPLQILYTTEVVKASREAGISAEKTMLSII